VISTPGRLRSGSLMERLRQPHISLLVFEANCHFSTILFQGNEAPPSRSYSPIFQTFSGCWDERIRLVLPPIASHLINIHTSPRTTSRGIHSRLDGCFLAGLFPLAQLLLYSCFSSLANTHHSNNTCLCLYSQRVVCSSMLYRCYLLA